MYPKEAIIKKKQIMIGNWPLDAIILLAVAVASPVTSILSKPLKNLVWY